MLQKWWKEAAILEIFLGKLFVFEIQKSETEKASTVFHRNWEKYWAQYDNQSAYSEILLWIYTLNFPASISISDFGGKWWKDIATDFLTHTLSSFSRVNNT